MSLTDKYICTCKRCLFDSRNREFVGEGKKTKIILQNPLLKKVDKRIVDDCLLLLRPKEEKCDFLFDIGEIKTAYLVECKGSDILKAVDQISSTLNILGNEFQGYTLKGRIISTRVYAPDVRETSYKNLRERLKGNLITKNIVCTEII